MRDAHPVVSAVLIFLDAERFIQEAIESVLAQTFPDWELLAIDDGSTDRSTAIVQRYASLYPDRIRYADHPGHANRGKSTSRNLGLQHARGRYVAFLDADDVWLPDKLAEQIAVLERHAETVMVYGPTQYWYSWSGQPGSKPDTVSLLGVRPDTVYSPPHLLRRFLERTAIVPGICSILARRQAALAIGGFEETIQHMFEDQTLIAKLCLHGPVYVSARCCDRYRQHPWSSSALAIQARDYHPWKPCPARLAYMEWLSRYVYIHGGSVDDATRAAIRRSLRRERHPAWGMLAGMAGMALEGTRQRLTARVSSRQQ